MRVRASSAARAGSAPRRGARFWRVKGAMPPITARFWWPWRSSRASTLPTRSIAAWSAVVAVDIRPVSRRFRRYGALASVDDDAERARPEVDADHRACLDHQDLLAREDRREAGEQGLHVGVAEAQRAHLTNVREVPREVDQTVDRLRTRPRPLVRHHHALIQAHQRLEREDRPGDHRGAPDPPA